MKNSEVEAVLKFYKNIDLDIKATKGMLKQYEDEYDTRKAAAYDGMPHQGSTFDSTAMYANEIAQTNTAENIRLLRERLQELYKFKTEVLKEILELKPVHKTVIYMFYVQDQKWERIAEQINYSIRRSKDIRHIALKELGGKISANRCISGGRLMKEILYSNQERYK